MEEKLKEILEQVKEFRSEYLTNETAVREQLIHPILNNLGWNTSNPKFVRLNSRNEEGKIPDYTLYKNGKSVLIVEAKNLKTEIKDEKIISQLANYCYRPGIEFGIITNGTKWLLFNTFQKNPLERVVWTIDLESEDINIAIVIKRLLSISFNEVDKLEQSIQKIKALEKIWSLNCKTREDIVKLISNTIKEKSKKDNPNLVLDDQDADTFVETKLEELFENNKTTINSTEVEITKKDFISSNLIEQKGKKGPRTRIKVIFPDGIIIENKKAAETFVESIKKIGIERVRALNLNICNVPLVDNKEDNFYQQYQVPPNYYVMTHTSTKSKIAILEEISKKLSQDLRIELT